MEEKEDCNKVLTSNLRPKPQNCGVEGEGIRAKWDNKSGEYSLKDVTFSVKAREIMAVVGSVGSGKSSFLHVILSELPITHGTINVRGKVSYASQEPWLFSGTVKENILFGQPFNAKRYYEVIRVCALKRDLELFSEGDQTHVGERGVTLSGGQKARINLARAVYYDADIYLLDDPLSAVDAHVGKHLFEQCISGFLKNKVTILATHQLQFLKTTSHILALKNGHVQAKGTYNQIKNTGVDLATIIQEGEEEQTLFPPPEHQDMFVSKVTQLRRASQAWSMLHGTTNEMEDETFDTRSFTHGFDGSVVSLAVDDDLFVEFEEGNKEVGAETKSTGSVGSKIYLHYFLSGGGALVALLLAFLIVLAQAFFTGSDYWLSYWSNTEQLYGELSQNTNMTLGKSSTGNETMEEFVFTSSDRLRFVYIYTAITVGLILTALGRTVTFFKICMASSKKLHNRMFASVIRVPMLFFETHPIGQILNRFTKDIGQVDDLLPPAMFDFLTILFNFLGIVGMILALNVWLVIPTVVLGIFFLFMRWVYLSSARDIKRLEGITRSPVFSHLSSTFEGLATIRAFEAQSSASNQFDTHQDLHTSSWFLFVCSSRIFGAYLDLLSIIFIGIVTFSFMFQTESLSGDVGLGISLAMTLSGMLQWGVRQSAEVENHMTSIERILDYSKLTPETPHDMKLVKKEEGWPQKGKLTFEDVSLSYSGEPTPVLKNLNFTIEPAEKIGVVGRTGAGKSSLLSCIFRLTPPDGKIIIDGVDTETLFLEDLRRSLSIIPQDPTLFSGTVRYNLDPFSEYEDHQIWSALEEVELKDPVREMNGNLEARITEGGHNLSAGQRQLMCLARAILKHNKILVMDEATANVDPQTDNCIQETIRDKFSNCTVLTIAHRLHTIMDSDRVIVMDSGRLMEFRSPHQLLQDKDSIFYDLVNQTGPSTSQKLKKMAEESYLRKNGGHIDKLGPPKKIEIIISEPIFEMENEEDECTKL